MRSERAGQALSRAERKARRARKQRYRRLFLRALMCLLTAIALLMGGALATVAVVLKGPSPTASDIFVISALETSAMKFVPRLFLSDAEIASVLDRNTVLDAVDDTDTSLVHIGEPSADDGSTEDMPDIEVIDIEGPTFNGKMMIVKDPSRVTVGTCGKFGSTGKTLMQIYKQYDAVGALNGGAFMDTNGQGSGGTPDGIVVSNGKLLWSKAVDTINVKTVIGFNKDDKLVFSKVTSEAAKAKKMRDAVSFGPVLVNNGKPAAMKGTGSGMNPRSAIGQRADGAVLLLVIDGRKVNSMGATLKDLIDIFIEHGAVNAANLDGGSSSYLIHEGKYQNVGSSLTGPRGMATAFVVR